MFKKLIISSLALLVSLLSNNAMAIEEPKYKVLKTAEDSSENWELRHYESFNIAKVYVKAGENNASSYGFRPLANYIFGGNDESKKMAMTAPVMQQSIDDNLHQISFVMPEKFNLEDLPKPDNQKVKIEQYPESKFLVVRFSGGWSAKKWKKRALKLQEQAEKNNFEVLSTPIYARYNDPWTPSFFRRNEILIAVK
ncbi:heme-binding protein [Kangiella sp. HZ709]|uniref:SOUL family heme-binding protein n=1 Tax=Kangiella sp. HZ709 TaxID=2666328 RepID=UPI0018A1DE79|nr:heme-binding protein [Kangiella sp. HZ709]